jgi:ribosome-binding factor A
MAARPSRRRVPELHFVRDKNLGVEDRIDFLLRRAKKSRVRTEK